MASKGTLTSPVARRALVNGAAPKMPTCSRTRIPSALVSARESAFILAWMVKSNWPAEIRARDEARRRIQREAGRKRPGRERPRFGSATFEVICSVYGVPTVPGAVDSGPSVSLPRPWLMVIRNESSEGFLNGQVSSRLYVTVR